MQVSLTTLDRTRLRRWLALFFVALAIPSGVLVYQAYSQLKWGAFHQHQSLAEEFATRIDDRIRTWIDAEEARSFSDYAFLVVAGEPSASFLQRSPLSTFPVDAPVPGLIGYFQVDARGTLSTPLLPQAGIRPAQYGISPTELEERVALADRIGRILSENSLVQAEESRVSKGVPSMPSPARRGYRAAPQEVDTVEAPVQDSPRDTITPSGETEIQRGAGGAQAEVPAQAAFDLLNAPSDKLEKKSRQLSTGKLGRVEDLKLDNRFQIAPREEEGRAQIAVQKSSPAGKRARTERSVLPELARARRGPVYEEQQASSAAVAPGKSTLNISIFESEIDPFEFSLLGSGHFVLFRKVWRDGQRYIQGALLEQEAFLQGVIRSAFTETALSQMSDLIVAYQGEVFSAYTGDRARGYLASAQELSGALLYQTRLSVPLSELELIFSITHLPPGPGGALLTWVAIILALVLFGGFYLMYRLGAQQIDLARQQQDFVSAVSHELKTPLTSIRMYGEMLREGWAPEEKKKRYYDFIFDESERLSRLISNVLQLASMTRNEVALEIRPVPVAELLDVIRSKVSTQIERAGFELDVLCEDDVARTVIEADRDALAQIMINLVDNALKFSAKAERKIIDIRCRHLPHGDVLFSVRDYGPGVPADQMKKIFKLFYRSENELTRETVGTGIGLALVLQLVQTMHARMDVVNKQPGAEFRLYFPVGRR